MTLYDTARTLMAERKGIFSLHESASALDARFARFDIPPGEESRKKYYELLFSTAGIEGYVSAVLLSEEALKQSDSDGVIFSELLASKNILVGVALGTDESDQGARLQEYKSFSAVCAKRSIVFSVDDVPGSQRFIEEIGALVRFALVCQKINLVPILGMTLDQKGPHTASEAEDAIQNALSILMAALSESAVDVRGLVIETSMAATGSENPLPATAIEVGERTVRALSSSISKGIAGILLFSDGETPKTATTELNAIARLEPFQWPIAFSFSGVLENPTLAAWQGLDENIPDAQAVFLSRISLASLADAAGYTPEME